MKLKSIFVVVLVSGISLFGCASSPMDYKAGARIKSEQLAQFSPGSTIQLDVVSAVGHPSRKVPLNDNELWYYEFARGKVTVFEWDASGKLIQTYKSKRIGTIGNAPVNRVN